MKKVFIYFFLFIGLPVLKSQVNIDSLFNSTDTIKDFVVRGDKICGALSKIVLSNTQIQKSLEKISELGNKSGSKKNAAITYNYRGNILYFQKKFNEALTEYFTYLKLAEELKDKDLILHANCEIGETYFKLDNHAYSIKHLNYAQQNVTNKTSNKYLKSMYSLYGTTYKTMNQFDSALKYHQKAIEIKLKIGDKKDLAGSYNNVGLVYKRMKQYDKALEYYNQSLKIKREFNDKKGQASTLINMGNIHTILKDNKKAFEELTEGTKLAKEVNEGEFFANGIEGLADNYYQTGEYKKASDYYLRYKQVRDSLNQQKTSKQIAELTAQYETNKKDAEITLQQEQLRSQEAVNSKQKIITLASTIALVMALIAIFFVYRSYRQNKKNALILARKNHEIEEKNKEITDSINYAKLIQQSLLASKEMLDRNLDSYFILYKPKDIVSGDFYWATETDKGFLIACVDCTGHGVPGAFMSLIGKENLDKAVSKSVNPGQILKELNVNVKRSLNQTESSKSRDGMDAAVIRVEKEQNGEAKLYYAGANRPLYILRHQTQTIEEIKATKQAIGGFTRSEQEFEEHLVKVNKGDTVVISTDGYADQFGSDKNKKLTTKRFKELLISVQSKSSHDQKNNLESFFNDWKGKNEQLDDLLVIGITI